MKREIMKTYQVYGLYAVYKRNRNRFFRVRDLEENHYTITGFWNEKNVLKVAYDSDEYSPLLYPISYLEQSIKVKNGVWVHPLDKILELIIQREWVVDLNSSDNWIRSKLLAYFNNNCTVPLPHQLMQIAYRTLYALHIDLDNLIETRQAIDVTTTKGNPYEIEGVDYPE